MQTFACTACHEGQGSATDFKWASHAPNDVIQEKAWAKKYGYFNNEHWIYPMYPARFTESACLKCHHEVVELEPSEKFPEPPAPHVTHGYHLIRKYGCYGCHEVKGYEGPNKRIGPDMRLEANYFAASLQLRSLLESTKTIDKLQAEERRWINTLAESPERADVRGRILEMLLVDEKAAEPRFPTNAHKLASLFKDEETPGDLRKAGPSLRYMTSKLDDQFAFDWMREPKHFRPSTRMPQFFGLWDHLEGHSKELAAKFEPAELLGMLTYLKGRSQSFEYLTPPTVKEPAADNDAALQQARVERGKVAFEERGCLACHTHQDFPEVSRYRRPNEIVQGPDLTGLGSKFAPERNPNGTKWLYSWIKEPTKYHARTVMPNLYLDPVEIKDEKGVVTATVDPVADIVAYLMTSTNENWKAPEPATLTAAQSSVDDLVLEYLSEAFFEQDAKDFQKKGIPNKRAASLKGPEREMLVSDEDFTSGKGPTLEQKLSYVGRKTIGKYGCFGCHDMPGFEDAKPIGTGLADWGRKEIMLAENEMPGLMAYKSRPDYARVVDITTIAALREMIAPGIVAVATPVLVGVLLGAEAVAGLLIVGTISGVLLATVLNNSGGAWDNAKKFIESGGLKDRRGKVLGKGSAAHAAAVVGDTVGDPFKDTSSVALNPVIKFTTLFGLLAVQLAVQLKADMGGLVSHALAGVFFAVSVVFVLRSFYGMRIGTEVKGKAHA